MEACDLRTLWENLSFLEDSTKQRSLRIADGISSSFAFDPRYENGNTNDSALFESQVASQCFDALKNQMSRESPETFSFTTSPPSEAPSPDMSPTSCPGMTMLAERTSPRSRRPQGVLSPGVNNKVKRKVQEKNRRDNLCAHVDQMLKLLPSIDCTSKKPTKIKILRTAASQLRLGYHFPRNGKRPLGTFNGEIRPSPGCSPGSLDDAMSELFEVSNGFILVIEMSKLILFATPNVESFLGFKNTELMGRGISKIIHEADCARLEAALKEVSTQSGTRFRPQGDELVSEPYPITCKFLEKPEKGSDYLSYKVMRCTATLRGPLQGAAFDSRLLKLTLFAQAICFSPIRKFGVTDAIQNEYVTQHKIDGTIVFADHRISTLTGYFPNEVLWKSAHNYMVEEDRAVAKFALGQMLSKNKGVLVYRLRTESGKCIYLRSFGYVTCNSKMEREMFVCYNTALDDEYGEQQRLEFVRRYTRQMLEQMNKAEAVTSEAVARITDVTEAADSDEYVCGGRSQNPLAIENLIEDDLRVGSNSMIRLKPKGHDMDDLANGSDTYDEPHSVGCLQGDAESMTLPTVAHNLSLSGRESTSPEFPEPLTPATTVSSPLSSDMGSPLLVPAAYPVNYQILPSGGAAGYPPSNQWLYPDSDGCSASTQLSPALAYPAGNFALTPNSLSPDPKDVQDRSQLHEY